MYHSFKWYNMTGPPQVDYKTENGITTVIRWYSPGRMFSFSEWKADTEEYEDERHGVSRKWDEEGQLVYEAHFKDGKLHGTKQMWWENGNPCLEVTHDQNGTPISGRSWHRNGVLGYEEDEDGLERQYTQTGEPRERTIIRRRTMGHAPARWLAVNMQFAVRVCGDQLFYADYSDSDDDDRPRDWDGDEDCGMEESLSVDVE
jgi:hypothetical protein